MIEVYNIVLCWGLIVLSMCVRNNFALMHRRTLSPKPCCSSCLVGLFKLRGAVSRPTGTLVIELQSATFYQFRPSQKAPSNFYYNKYENLQGGKTPKPPPPTKQAAFEFSY